MKENIKFKIMMKCSYFLILICVCLSISVKSQVPAHHFTPGLPWTVISPDDVPLIGQDTTLFNDLSDWVNETSELRYIFRVHYHPELIEIVDGKLYAELPRDPGVTEIVHWNNVRIDSSELDGLGDSDRIVYRANGSSHPSVAPFSPFMLLHTLVLDTAAREYPESFFATVDFAPGSYMMFGGPLRPVGHRYGHFIQVVDSIFHPRVSSTREKLTPISTHVFPNPCKDYLTIEIPELWAQHETSITIMSSTGKVVYQGVLHNSESKFILNEPIIGQLDNGYYSVFIRRKDGENGVAYTNFLKQE